MRNSNQKNQFYYAPSSVWFLGKILMNSPSISDADRREDFLTHLQSMLEEVQTLQRQRFSVEKITRKGEKYTCCLVLGAARFMFSMKPASRHDSSHDLRHIVDIKHVTGAPGSIVLTMANQRKYRFESQLAAEIFTKFQEHLRGMGLQPTCSVVDSDTGEAFANASGRTGPGTKVYELALEKECRTQTSVELRARTLVVAGNQILERDPATHRTLAAHSLQDVWSIVRYADDLARFALEYTNDDDAHPHHYRTAQRDLFLANLLDAYVCTRAHAVPPLERLKSILPASGVGGAPSINSPQAVTKQQANETPVCLSSNNGRYWAWIQPAESCLSEQRGVPRGVITAEMESYCTNRVVTLIQLTLRPATL